MLAPADAAAQLMQLRQPEPLGMLDDHHRRIRHVDADFHDRGRHQDLKLARPANAFITRSLRIRLHPPVQQPDAVLRETPPARDGRPSPSPP